MIFAVWRQVVSVPTRNSNYSIFLLLSKASLVMSITGADCSVQYVNNTRALLLSSAVKSDSFCDGFFGEDGLRRKRNRVHWRGAAARQREAMPVPVRRSIEIPKPSGLKIYPYAMIRALENVL